LCQAAGLINWQDIKQRRHAFLGIVVSNVQRNNLTVLAHWLVPPVQCHHVFSDQTEASPFEVNQKSIDFV
jgi:hypothetical protein